MIVGVCHSDLNYNMLIQYSFLSLIGNRYQALSSSVVGKTNSLTIIRGNSVIVANLANSSGSLLVLWSYSRSLGYAAFSTMGLPDYLTIQLTDFLLNIEFDVDNVAIFHDVGFAFLA